MCTTNSCGPINVSLSLPYPYNTIIGSCNVFLSVDVFFASAACSRRKYPLHLKLVA